MKSKQITLFLTVLLFIIFQSASLTAAKSDTQSDSTSTTAHGIQKTSPVGYWKTIDDKTKETKSIVKIWISDDGTLKGRIEKIFRKPGEDQNPKCDKCKGEKHNQPVLGMEFMWGFHGEAQKWENGKILDPENGKVYHCQLKMTPDGKKLNVYGYIKILFKIGRSQTWIRQEMEDADINK